MFKNIPQNVQTTLAAFLPMFIIVVLIVFVGKFGFSQVNELRKQIILLEKNETVLTNKVNVLQSVSAEAKANLDLIALIFPAENPAVVVLAQVRQLALENSLTLGNYKGGIEIKENSGLSRVDISFDVEGTKPSIIAFVQSINKVAPITKVSELDLADVGGVARASVSIKSYWAPFPEKLPAVTDSITDLSSEDRQTISEISGFRVPPFVFVGPSETGGKSNPFQ